LRLPDDAVVSRVERQYRAPPEPGPPKAAFIRCASPVIAFATQEHPDGLRIPRGFGARWPIRDELRLPDNAVVSHVERQYRAPPETGPPKGAPW
jgi:hypothetical protein